MMNNKSRKKASKAAGTAKDMHPADIKCALEKAGWTLRQLSTQNNMNSTVCTKALKHRWPRAEKIIADALNLQPWDIWPTRYNENNEPIRLPMGRPSHKQHRAKHSTKASEKRQGDSQ